MSQLRFHLFGNFHACQTDDLSLEFITGKPEQLFCFVLLHRQITVARENLATALWENLPATQSRKYLRDALWKLQERLSFSQKTPPVLLVSAESVCLNPAADIWVDVIEFEKAFSAVKQTPGPHLTLEQAQLLRRAVELYRGDLLEGCYQDWCLCERVRLQDMHLVMLHKLMLWCEARGHYDEGLHYGETILQFDRAHERAYRGMMRLRYLANDRIGALRQYERLVAALDTELGVKPSQRSIQLYEQIRADQADKLSATPSLPTASTIAAPEPAQTHLPELLEQCKNILASLKGLENQLQREVELIELSLKSKG